MTLSLFVSPAMFNAGLRDEGLLDLNLIWSSATRSWWLVSNSAPLKTLELLSSDQRDFTRTWSISAVVLPSLEYQVKQCLSSQRSLVSSS